MRLIRRLVGNPSAAEDLVQDVFVNVLRSSHDQQVDNAQAYLSRCATNVALDHLRRERSRARYASSDELSGDEVCAAPLQDDVVQGRQELELLRRAIEELPPICKAVFLLSRDHGLTMREISERLGISPKTVEKHIQRAMTACRQTLRAAGRNV